MVESGQLYGIWKVANYGDNEGGQLTTNIGTIWATIPDMEGGQLYG